MLTHILQDANIGFAVKDAAGAAATKVCPGEQYSVEVTLGSSRYLLLTARDGVLGGQTTSCANRAFSDYAASDFKQSLKVACDSTSSRVDFKVTSATGKSAGYLQNTGSIGVNSTCAAASCSEPPASPVTPPPANAANSHMAGSLAALLLAASSALAISVAI